MNTASQSDDKAQEDVHLHITKTLYGTTEMKSASHQQAVPWCADKEAQWYLNSQIPWKKYFGVSWPKWENFLAL